MAENSTQRADSQTAEHSGQSTKTSPLDQGASRDLENDKSENFENNSYSGFRKPATFSRSAARSNTLRSSMFVRSRIDYDDIPDEACEQLVQGFAKDKKNLPALNERASVFRYIARSTLNNVYNKNYKKADQLHRLKLSLTQELKLKDSRDLVNERNANSNLGVDDYKGIVDSRHKEWNQREKEFKNETKQGIDDRNRMQKEEEKEFDDYYNDVDHLRPYTKISPQLIQVLSKERRAVYLNQYNDAQYFRKQSMKIEREETEKAQKRAETEIMHKKHLLMSKQESQRNRYINYRENKHGYFQKERETETDVLNKRVSLLEKRQAEVYKENEHITYEPSVPGQVIQSNSPRTQAEYDKFRRKTVNTKLNIQPITNLAKKCRI